MAETLVNKTQAGEGIWTSDNLVAGSGISIQQVPQPVIDENTICLWHLDDDVNNTIEGGNPFFPSASWTFNNARFGKGLFYSSTSTQRSIGFPNYSNTQNFTLDFWFKLTQSNQYFVFYTYYNASQRLEFYNTYLSLPGSTVSTVTYPSGTNVLDWTHFALVNDYSSNKTYYFINGIKFHEASSFYYLQNGALARYGAIDEVRVSNVARWTSDFTPFTQPYAASAGPTQYAINNTKSNELPSQTGNSGKYLTTDGTNASWATVSGLQNLATGSNALTLIGQASTKSNSINLGYYSYVSKNDAIAIGSYTYATGDKSIAIGPASSSLNTNTQASATDSIAIGKYARASASSAVQLGTGTNSTASTLQFLNTTVVNASGKIPAANLDTAIPTVDQTYDATSTNAQSGTAVASAISGKVDIADLSQVECIVETYHNGTSWYRVWSDGWCEQGGYVDSGVGSVASGSQVTFLKAFADTNYTITFLSSHSDTSTDNLAVQYGNYYYGCYYPSSKATTGIMLRGCGTWKAEGYIA